MSILAPALVRTLVLTAISVVAFVVADRSGSTDPLAIGLGLFMLLAAIAFVWGLVDGIRHPTGQSLLVWLIVAVALGAVPMLVDLVRGVDDAFDEAVETIIFTVFLVGLPAAIGIGVGAVVQRVRT